MAIPRGQTPERKAYMKAWQAANPRDRRAYLSVYRAAHRAEASEYRAKIRHRKKATNAKWYADNRAMVLARVKAHASSHRERILAYQAEYYAAHSDKVKATVAAYRAAYPEKKQHLENRRQARKAGNGGSHTLEQRLAKFAEMGHACFYCGATGRLTVDHDIPLERGGTDDIDNILPACRSCNSRKHTRTAQEFIAQRTGGVGVESAGPR